MMNSDSEYGGRTGLLSVTELSRFLQISIPTIYYKVHRNEIPYIKIGRHLRFNLDEVLDHFKAETERRRACVLPDFDLNDPSSSLKIGLTDLFSRR